MAIHIFHNNCSENLKFYRNTRANSVIEKLAHAPTLECVVKTKFLLLNYFVSCDVAFRGHSRKEDADKNEILGRKRQSERERERGREGESKTVGTQHKSPNTIVV